MTHLYQGPTTDFVEQATQNRIAETQTFIESRIDTFMPADLAAESEPSYGG